MAQSLQAVALGLLLPWLPAVSATELSGFAPKPGVSNEEFASFVGRVPSLLRSSGDQVGGAVESMLHVQGHLNDMRDDLSHEYKHWRTTAQTLQSDHDDLVNMIKGLQATLLTQEKVRAESQRLRKDLELAAEQGNHLQSSREFLRKEAEDSHATLRTMVSSLEKEVDDTRSERSRQMRLAEAHAADALKQQSDLQKQAQDLDAAVKHAEVFALKQRTDLAANKTKLLSEVSVANTRIQELNKELKNQTALLAEQKRLAERTSKVARTRQELEARRSNCSLELRKGNDQVAAAAKALRDGTAQLQRCQATDADNQRKQAKINECRAVKGYR